MNLTFSCTIYSRALVSPNEPITQEHWKYISSVLKDWDNTMNDILHVNDTTN